MSTVGIIANPAAGKDIRRLVAAASPTSDVAKMGIIRRAVIGAAEAGVDRVLLANDRRSLSWRAVDGLDVDASIELLDEVVIDTGRDSRAAAARMRDEGVGVVVVLGGDGTHRDVAKGWLDAPIVTVSTGTNNVFPRLVEATTAGLAAGAVATGRVPLSDVADVAKVIHVSFPDRSVATDLALVDIALVDGRFVGSRAVWDADRLRDVVACIAEPDTVGLSSIAARCETVDRREPGGVHVRIGAGRSVRAPMAPGMFVDVSIAEAQRIKDGDEVRLQGAGVLAFDGERDVTLADGESAVLTIRRDGPRVIDLAATLARFTLETS